MPAHSASVLLMKFVQNCKTLRHSLRLLSASQGLQQDRELCARVQEIGLRVWASNPSQCREVSRDYRHLRCHTCMQRKQRSCYTKGAIDFFCLNIIKMNGPVYTWGKDLLPNSFFRYCCMIYSRLCHCCACNLLGPMCPL
ncbi:prosaposin-like [Iris pallida]|uniref:Prosaposin-like n=1 Tax=Iris pallida TaxID=29817 RepID=A0AAX6GHU3_IRIPA|nr:prosaposin-like [Iris pallida]